LTRNAGVALENNRYPCNLCETELGLSLARMKPKLTESDDTSDERKFVAEFDPTPILETALVLNLVGGEEE